MRNCVMVGTADAVIAVWDGKGLGTKHSIDYATSQGKQVLCLKTGIKQGGWQINSPTLKRFRRTGLRKIGPRRFGA
jgi:hypothetical protein